FFGWVVGREELPFGAGTSGVVLYTGDGGLHWHRKALHMMPGLDFITFVDQKIGYAAGDGSDQHPSGVFMTRDSGLHWQALPGPWNRLAYVKKGQVIPAVADELGGRAVKAVHRGKDKGARTVAVGQGGLLLLMESPDKPWSSPEISLPEDVISCWDLHAVHG